MDRVTKDEPHVIMVHSTEGNSKLLSFALKSYGDAVKWLKSFADHYPRFSWQKYQYTQDRFAVIDGAFACYWEIVQVPPCIKLEEVVSNFK